MNKNPLVTIITPVYNQAKYISQTIESILSQDYKNIEYLVINDGSTDDTVKVLERYTDVLHWETHSNIGETRTVNEAVIQAKGDLVGIVNSDDPLLPGAIRELVNAFENQPDLIVAYPDWVRIDAESKIIETVKTFEFNYENMLRWHYCIPSVGALFKRDVFILLGGRDPQFRYVADYDFWLRAGLVGRFDRVPKTLACHRWYKEGTSSALRGLEMAEEHVQLVNKIYSMPNLSENIIKLKNESYCSANYIAGVVCGNNLLKRASYFLLAIRYAPIKYFGEYRYRIIEMIFGVFISQDLRRMIKRIIQAIKNT